MIAPMRVEVEENITALNVSESVVFGLSKLVSEDLKNQLSESAVFGLTMKGSEDLQNNLSESVTITNV